MGGGHVQSGQEGPGQGSNRAGSVWVGVLGVGTVFALKRREEREKVESG